MSKHPTWATKHKRKGTELRFINGRYYLYAVSSKRDSIKKRPKKITGKLLGKITEKDGFVESEKAKLAKQALLVSELHVKEYGVTAFLESHLNKYEVLLQKHFPDHWKSIIALAYGKLVHQSCMKNIEYHYTQSYLSCKYPNLSLSGKALTSILREIGVQRNFITNFFQEFNKSNDNIVFDGTDLLTNSKKMDLPKISKSKQGTFESLLNIMFVFSVDLQIPIYYRLLSGDIKDVKAFKLCLQESNIKNAVVILDKGFYSQDNIDQLEKEDLKYIILLHRNNKLIDYNVIKSGDKKSFKLFFKYEGRIIWYYTLTANNHQINVYLDEELKTREIKDYLDRVEKLPEEYNLEKFHEKQYSFGTISFIYNIQKTPQEIYVDYKSRGQIESMIKALKNTFEADKSYMQNEQALETWMFINFITIHWYYTIYKLLSQKKLNSIYSPMDLISFLKEIKKIKINNEWYDAEITKKTSDLLRKLDINIT